MSRLAIAHRGNVPPAAGKLLDAVESSLGQLPNLFLLAARSPSVLDGMVALNGAVARTLDARTRERIALAVAEVNGCDYCLSAHTYLGLNLARLDETEIARNRAGSSSDPKAAAATGFAKRVAETRGQVLDADIAAIKEAGYGEAEIIEVIANVALNTLTNLLNNVALTDIDFPVVMSARAA
jgi:uncharacterized peroxidase-related enzyme